MLVFYIFYFADLKFKSCLELRGTEGIRPSSFPEVICKSVKSLTIKKKAIKIHVTICLKVIYTSRVIERKPGDSVINFAHITRNPECISPEYAIIDVFCK